MTKKLEKELVKFIGLLFNEKKLTILEVQVLKELLLQLYFEKKVTESEHCDIENFLDYHLDRLMNNKE